MSDIFRELLRKVGSGVHTGKDLSREEADCATRLMLEQEATPAQIGAFMIAHRIKRPTAEELAGMLDAYDALSDRLSPLPDSTTAYPVTVLGVPYDGRSRTAPVTPLTALILATASCPVIMHGGDCLPTKYGISMLELWRSLGVDWSGLSLSQVQAIFEQTQLGFVYLNQLFPKAAALVPYREQIGKRPPFATAELMWSPYTGTARIVVGYVHPPTEGLAQRTFALRQTPHYTTVKGLEGSCDLPRDRTCIIGVHKPSDAPDQDLERLLLHPRDYGFAGNDVPLDSPDQLLNDFQVILAGEINELGRSVIWNGGFHLWQCGVCSEFSEGLAMAENLIQQGKVLATLNQLQQTVRSLANE